MDPTSASDKGYELKNAIYAHSRIVEYLKLKSISEPNASHYWQEELEAISYLWDAGPSIIGKLRDHTHWLTGIRSYDYKNHHSHQKKKFMLKLQSLSNLEPSFPVFGELGVLGDFGHVIDGKMINLDTLKFIESCIALKFGGVFDVLSKKERPVICEIGAGWGGFITHLERYIPNSQFVVVDLPGTLLFSATYLHAAFPTKTLGLFGEEDFTGSEDFIFILPEDFINQFSSKIDLTVNMVSFQEMTSAQVAEYSKKVKLLGSDYLYSHNRTKSNHNPEIEDVDRSIGKWDIRKEIYLLPVDYTFLDVPQPKSNVKLRQIFCQKIVSKSKFLRRIVDWALSDFAKQFLFGSDKIQERRNYKHVLYQNVRN